MFYSGQKVVCVDATTNPRWGTTKLTQDAIYTVLRPSGLDSDKDLGLFLVEVESPPPSGFKAHRFRPAVDGPTDISLLTELLTNPNKRIKDDAHSKQRKLEKA